MRQVASALACLPNIDRSRPLRVGLAGAQGSGKTSLARSLAQDPKIATLSLDDFYLGHSTRERLARTVHPLLATRGVPGTHDLDLASDFLDRLEGADADSRTPLPRFDKLADDRLPETQWSAYHGRPQLILMEGWCLGATVPPADQEPPPNRLEQEEDRDGSWRQLVWRRLGSDYRAFFDRFDAFLFLSAPNFATIGGWRRQQEEEALGRSLTPGEVERLDRFLLYYERITRTMLAGWHRARFVFHLSERRDVVRVEDRGGSAAG